MKKCNKCEQVKALVEFNKDKHKGDGLQSKCRDCQKQYRKQHCANNPEYYKKYFKDYYEQYKVDNPDYYKQIAKKQHLKNPGYFNQKAKQYQESKKDGLFHVYYLPIHNYVGYTGNVYTRMIMHKYQGNNTTGYEIWKSFDNEADAKYFEALLHAGGYEGNKRMCNTNK
jgi:hypothetical protein